MRLLNVLPFMLALLATPAASEDIRIVAFNIERGFAPDAQLSTVAKLMDSVGPAAVWGLAEASSGDDQFFKRYLGRAYGSKMGTRGSDYLLILFDKRKFELLDSGEVFLTSLSFGERQPLWVKLKSRRSGATFYVVENHLIRGQGDDPHRRAEAQDLNTWAKSLDAPAIAIGDFNLDFDVNYAAADEAHAAQRSQAFDVLTGNDVWAWVRPDALMPTQCDPDYDSVLDFAFVAGSAKNWRRESTILDIGCHDDAKRPDHLPIALEISLR